MGHCCGAHLLTMITEYLRRSKDNKVEVKKVMLESVLSCDYCGARAEYIVPCFG